MNQNFDYLKDVTAMPTVITPEMAEKFLEMNISNRRLDKSSVGNYMRILDSGQFILSNDAICFASNGVLLNGQHRLKACQESGIPFAAIVIRNMPVESYVVMDNGKNRSASDVLYVQGVGNSALTAAIIRRVLVLNRQRTSVGDLGSQNKISNSEIENEYKNHKSYWDDLSARVSKISQHGRYHNLIKGSDIGSIVAYLNLSLKHPIDRCYDFFEEIAGRTAATNEVITLLQDRLRESKNFIGRKLPPFVVQKLIIKAWNAYITGKTYSRFFYNEKTDKDLWFV